VSVSPQQARALPEIMSDAGTMSWDLSVNKQLSYSVGYGASAPLRALRAFDMFWHVEGMKTAFEGELTYNGVRYLVKPDTCAGYQDKNWGRDFTSPWIWLNCNRFVDEQGQTPENTSLDIGGGLPRVWGVPLGEKVLAAFYLRGKLHQFNFSHVLLQQQRWECTEEADVIRWKLDLKNRTHRLEVEFTCPKDGMLLVNYENPAGQKNHHRLWNGGHASGTLVLTTRWRNRPVARLTGSMGGCEYGRV